MAVLASPGVSLLPSHEQIPTSTNFISTFDFTSQYLPDVYEEEFARYGDGRLTTFLAQNSAEFPFESDMVKWTEKGRLHVKYTNVTSAGVATADTATLTINDTLNPADGGIALRKGQTFMIDENAGNGYNKGVITDVDTAAGTIDVAYYEGGGQNFAAAAACTLFVWGSDFKKATIGMEGSNVSQDDIYENNPLILKDSVEVANSDLAQITWVHIKTEEESGYLWFLRSKSDTRKRFDNYLETSALEAVPAEAGSGVIGLTTGDYGNVGSEGVFYVVENRGNVWGAGNPSSLADFDTIVTRLDKQGAIEENMLYVDRGFSFDIDDMLGAANAGYSGGISYGLFNNDKDMALTLGFKGFYRGYEFYKNDWKYLNEETMRGSLASGGISGLLIPAGSTNVYEQTLGSNVTRPYLHVRYRKSKWKDRKYVMTVTTEEQTRYDKMTVDFTSERMVCTLGAVNFFLFQD